MKEIQAAKAARRDQYKDHDRMVMVERGRAASFAVFDGAGDPLASSLAARVFKRHSAKRRPPALPETFQAIQQGIRLQHPYFVARAIAWNVSQRDQGANIRKTARKTLGRRDCLGMTTGTAARLNHADGQTIMDYAHAGDSSLYVFDHEAGQLSKVTRDESGALASGEVDASNFLGSKSHKLQQIGRLALPEAATIALFTDGINDPRFPDSMRVTDTRLGEILAGEPDAQKKALSLRDASYINDDSSVIIIEHRI